MAKGNDGNYLQHCVEVEAAVRLRQACPDGRLHIALTHGMAPFEQIKESKACKRLLYGALCEAAGEPNCNQREIVKKYRKSWDSQAYRPDIANLFDQLKTGKHYPNSGELLRAVIGTDRLSGGITEVCQANHKELAKAWIGSKVKVAHSSWRKQLGSDGALSCPDSLDTPWLFSMDPMRYSEGGLKDDDKLHRSDLSLLVDGLIPYFNSGQPGIACLFVYGVGSQNEDSQCQFWAFIDDLAQQLGAAKGSYWIHHIGGNRNLAGLLFSDQELTWGFAPPRIEPGRGRKWRGSRMQAEPARQGTQASGESLGKKVCPECGHVFQGNGWDGINAHWRSKHEHIMSYEEAWPLLSSGSYGKGVSS